MHRVGYLQRLYRDARSRGYKIYGNLLCSLVILILRSVVVNEALCCSDKDNTNLFIYLNCHQRTSQFQTTRSTMGETQKKTKLIFSFNPRETSDV